MATFTVPVPDARTATVTFASPEAPGTSASAVIDTEVTAVTAGDCAAIAGRTASGGADAVVALGDGLADGGEGWAATGADDVIGERAGAGLPWWFVWEATVPPRKIRESTSATRNAMSGTAIRDIRMRSRRQAFRRAGRFGSLPDTGARTVPAPLRQLSPSHSEASRDAFARAACQAWETPRSRFKRLGGVRAASASMPPGFCVLESGSVDHTVTVPVPAASDVTGVGAEGFAVAGFGAAGFSVFAFEAVGSSAARSRPRAFAPADGTPGRLTRLDLARPPRSAKGTKSKYLPRAG